MELSVRILSDRPMERLNWEALGHRGTTDVLSFPQGEVVTPKAADRLAGGAKGVREVRRALERLCEQSGPVPMVLGDIVICLPQARRQAREQGIPVEMELRRLLVHGISHLVGFDHERSHKAEAAMHAFEDALLLELA